MDFFGEALNQIRDLFRTMTPAARITSALLLCVIVVSLGYLFKTHGTGPSGYLFNGRALDPNEVEKALAAIASAGLDGAEREGNRIRIPIGQESQYMGAIVSGGALPASFDTLIVDSLEGNPFTSRTVQEEKIKAARERRIAMMLRGMEGVRDAKVMYAVSNENSRSRFAKSRATASVSILPEASTSLTSQQIKMIRQAVASANGMLPEDVSLLDQRSGIELVGSGAGGAIADFDDPYYATKIRYEKWLEREVRDLLYYLPDLRVKVAAELDTKLTTESHSISSQGEATPIREITEKESTENSRNENAGRVGLAAQGPGRQPPNESVAQTQSTTTIENSDVESLVPRSDTFTTESGLTPDRVKVSISVPSDYVLDVWRKRELERDPDADPAAFPTDTQRSPIQTDIDNRITEAVAQLLPHTLAEERDKNVSVQFFDSLAPDPVEGPSVTSEALSWASRNFNTVVMAGVVLVGLGMLRSLVKSIPPPAPVTSGSGSTISLAGVFDDEQDTGQAAASTGLGNGTGPATDGENRPKLKLNKGPNLKDDLTEIVREDPDAAAAILRSWIGNAG